MSAKIVKQSKLNESKHDPKKPLSDIIHIAQCLERDQKVKEERERKQEEIREKELREEELRIIREELRKDELRMQREEENESDTESIDDYTTDERSVEKRVVKEHPISYLPLKPEHYKKPYNVYRRAKLILFSSCLNQHEKFWQLVVAKKMSLIEKIERSCMNYAVLKANEENIPTAWSNDLFQELYHSICNKISSNIAQDNNVKNTYLPKLIFEEKIDINALPKMSSQELYPAKYKDIIIKIEASKKVSHTVKTSSMYKCKRCHQSKCSIENRYNRSLDEGVNLTITCEVCRYEWNA